VRVVIVGTAILLSVLALSFCALTVMVLSQRRQVGVPTPPLPRVLPGVSILKPMKGADPGLAENLESFFRLDYPDYELLLGVDDPEDPAGGIALHVAAAHPNVRSRLVVDAREVGFNPKVNNLARLLRHARHDVLWISDSNTRVASDTLRDLVAHLEQPGVGLVSSPFRGIATGGLGGACESLQVNTFVMGGVSAVHRLLKDVCVVGKSMLLRRSTLARLGGFAFLGRFLAEDQVCGEEVARLGLGVTLSGRVIDNELGRLPVRSFVSRHLRWARIRRRMNPAVYAGEVLLNPVFVAFCVALVAHTWESLMVAVVALLCKSVLDATGERSTAAHRPLLVYPWLTLVKDVLVGLAWAVPFFSTSVTWRGNRFHVGTRTLLSPIPPFAPPILDRASVEARG
jgi:ceramide glucosyltransferase